MSLTDMPLGNIALYIALFASVLAIMALLLKEYKNNDTIFKVASTFTRLTAAALIFDVLLLAYYFATSNYSVNYVWEYSSNDLAMIYKIAATLAGQQGTYLFWAMMVGLSTWWVGDFHKSDKMVRLTQVVTLVVGIYFIVITLVDSPFATIYQLYPDIAKDFIPPDGNGLNALLINAWMLSHPILMFIPYGAAVVPFAAAVVFLLTGAKGWEKLALPTSRFTWLFLTLGIAVGGIWAYLILGWGGFWGWDPVETSSLVPWLMLTAFMHAFSQHRKNPKNFALGAPILACLTFVLIIFAALVTRSGIFSSIHAFGASASSDMLFYGVFAFGLFVIALWIRGYHMKADVASPEHAEPETFINRNNIFYATVILLSVLTFITFWGITFPAIAQFIQGVKLGIGLQFFNIWSFPVVILLLLALGFCMTYKESEKETLTKQMLIVAGITVIAGLLRTGTFYVLDHNSPFYINQPPLYKLIGSVSTLALFPGMIYATYSIVSAFSSEYKKIKGSAKMLLHKGGIYVIHISIVLILVGAVVSANFTQSYEANIPLSQKGQVVKLENGNGYGIKLVDFKSGSDTSNVDYVGANILDILSDPGAYVETVTISGKVSDIATQGGFMYMQITDDTSTMWAASNIIDLKEGELVTETGSLMFDFVSPSTNTTYPIILFAGEVSLMEASSNSFQNVSLEVYKDNKRIGKGTAEYIEYKNGDTSHPMVSRSLLQDEYVIFQGMSGYGVVPLTLKIVPMVNELWIGVILFSIGIIMLMIAAVMVPKREKMNNGQGMTDGRTASTKPHAHKKHAHKKSAAKKEVHEK